MLIFASVRRIAFAQEVRVCIRLTVDDNTAVGVEGLSRDGSRVTSSQEHKAGGNLRRLRRTADW